MKNFKTGFTLIELLVVIAIIGLLSSVVLASLRPARAKARDARRTLDIKQMQIVLELYYDDNKSYVSSGDVILDANSAMSAQLVPKYISKLPTSPLHPNDLSYRYYSAWQNPATFYAIMIPYETKPTCYVCGGPICKDGQGWWSVNICK